MSNVMEPGSKVIHIWTYRKGVVREAMRFLDLQGMPLFVHVHFSGFGEVFPREDLALVRTGLCWQCLSQLNTEEHLFCASCRWLICPNCWACHQQKNHHPKPIFRTFFSNTQKGFA